MSVYGVQGEDRDDYTRDESRELRRRSRRLLGELLKPHRARLVLLAVMVMIATGTTAAVPTLIAQGIDTALPALRDGNQTPLWIIAALFVLTAVVSGSAFYIYTVGSARVGQSILFTLRRRLFEHTQRLSLEFHEQYTSGRVIARQTSDLESIRDLLDQGLNELVRGVLFMSFTLIAMLVLDPFSGLILVVALIPAALLTRWFQARSTVLFRETRTTSARMIVHFVETMTGIRAVKAFRTERSSQDAFDERVEDYRDANFRTIRIFGIYEPGTVAIGAITIAAVVTFGAFRVLNGELPVGSLLAVALYSRNFFQPIQGIGMFFNGYQSAAAALEKISGVLQEDPTVPEPKQPRSLERPAGRIEFDHVRFAYQDDRVILPDFSLEVPAGQTIALVGTTGAGKSTLAKLISRFYDPTNGVVRLDGVDLKDLRNEELRRAVVMVTQEAYLFSGTVGENIALGKPDATDAEIEAAARAVGAHGFITELPDGYETDVNKRGGRVSAGQRQLISFARAFLADPTVLILDEATASLDIPSERLVQEGLQTLLADRTAIIIAHRLSTVAIADRVLVMEHGRIIEDGSPIELIELGGKFASLHRAWRESLV